MIHGGDLQFYRIYRHENEAKVVLIFMRKEELVCDPCESTLWHLRVRMLSISVNVHYFGYYQMLTEFTWNCYLKTNTFYQSGSPRHSIQWKWWEKWKIIGECKKRTCFSCRPHPGPYAFNMAIWGAPHIALLARFVDLYDYICGIIGYIFLAGINHNTPFIV